MSRLEELKKFYKGKTVLVTGHTGFKGSWMCMVLEYLEANVIGYALSPELLSDYCTDNMFGMCGIDGRIKSIIGDVRDFERIMSIFEEEKPEIVIHMAAQPIVRESYKRPVDTYEINVMGTVNLLECIRKTESVKSFVNVTTDKVYRNEERKTGYKEDEYLDGYDPYSNSKSCSELVTSSYRKSFFVNADKINCNMSEVPPYFDDMRSCVISTCRAGNVIGGGDFAKDRIIPDCVRAIKNSEEMVVRNPYSIRPYQHVLEPVVMYLELAMRQYYEPSISGAYNIGPEEKDCICTGELVELFDSKWNQLNNTDISWKNMCDGGPHEAGLLKLDCSKIKTKLGWKPRWSLEESMEMLVEWYSSMLDGGNMHEITREQIIKFLER